jgi:hypothetical protein
MTSSDPLAEQAQRVQDNWDRNYATTDGTGSAMISQYLFFTDPNFDDGLCDADGTKRPAYATWSALPVVAEEEPASAPEPAPAPVAVAAAAPATPAPQPIRDAAAPTLALRIRRQRLAKVLGRGLAVDVTASEPCRLHVEVGLGSNRIGRKARTVVRAGTARLRVPTRTRPLRNVRHPRLKVTVTATDAAGNRRRVSRHFTPE